MTYREAIVSGEKSLCEAGIADARNDAWLLLTMACKIDHTYYYMHIDEEMPEELQHEFEVLIKKRAERVPLQYITGEQEFMGMTFHVNSNVLIPRQDTETLVEEALKVVKPGMKVLDMCTGSGCVLISILKNVHGTGGYGYDISKQAINVAKENAKLNDVPAIFERSNLFEDVADETFDVVISRNLTWTLPNAEHAYSEWMRVLKTGGILLNFDANYGKDDASDTKDLPEQHAHFKVGNEMLEECERIKAQLPISRKNRPAYDVAVLCENTRGEIHIDTDLGKRIYLEKDEFYNPAPMFSICAVKK